MKKQLLAGAIALTGAFAFLCLPIAASAQPAWQVPPGWSFTGGYIGLNLGAVENIDNGYNTCYYGTVEYGIGCPLPVLGNMHAEGFIGGATLGYNWQIHRLVIGIEGDYDGSSLDGSFSYNGFASGNPSGGTLTASGSEGLSWLSTERLRLGFVTSPGSMIFLTGGAAQGQWQLQSNVANLFPVSTQTTRSGWAEGIGYETALAQRVTFKVDVLSYELSPFQVNVGGTPSDPPYTAGKDFYFHGATARIGLNWKL